MGECNTILSANWDSVALTHRHANHRLISMYFIDNKNLNIAQNDQITISLDIKRCGVKEKMLLTRILAFSALSFLKKLFLLKKTLELCDIRLTPLYFL